jgi:hypothetical protein
MIIKKIWEAILEMDKSMGLVNKAYCEHLPDTGCNIPMPENVVVPRYTDKICENCIKEDVCAYKEECTQAVKDILEIEGRENVFVITEIKCRKWVCKPMASNTR